MSEKRKMKPVITSDFWLLAPPPDLDSVIEERTNELELRPEPNDHTIFQSKDGMWNLWACVRNTKVGRLLCHWEAEKLTDSPWRFSKKIIRADINYGESNVQWKGQEFLQSPFVIEDGGKYYMFFGGYATGHDKRGNPTDVYAKMENQISLMISSDGKEWTRYKNEEGRSRVFYGPGAARDEYVVRFGDTWYMYYTGHHNEDTDYESIYVRTSKDLLHWSDWQIAHFISKEYRENTVCESPVVLYEKGYYYLFRSGGYKGGRGEGHTAVFRSEDPLNFGVCDDPKERYVCNIDAGAAEIIYNENGEGFISKIHDPVEGYRIKLARFRFEEDNSSRISI